MWYYEKIVYFSLILICVVCISGCGRKKDVVNTDSKLAVAKKSMTENLSNYSYDVEITAKTGLLITKIKKHIINLLLYLGEILLTVNGLLQNIM